VLGVEDAAVAVHQHQGWDEVEETIGEDLDIVAAIERLTHLYIIERIWEKKEIRYRRPAQLW
jgi:hypothetical protein